MMKILHHCSRSMVERYWIKGVTLLGVLRGKWMWADLRGVTTLRHSLVGGAVVVHDLRQLCEVNDG